MAKTGSTWNIPMFSAECNVRFNDPKIRNVTKLLLGITCIVVTGAVSLQFATDHYALANNRVASGINPVDPEMNSTPQETVTDVRPTFSAAPLAPTARYPLSSQQRPKSQPAVDTSVVRQLPELHSQPTETAPVAHFQTDLIAPTTAPAEFPSNENTFSDFEAEFARAYKANSSESNEPIPLVAGQTDEEIYEVPPSPDQLTSKRLSQEQDLVKPDLSEQHLAEQDRAEQDLAKQDNTENQEVTQHQDNTLSDPTQVTELQDDNNDFVPNRTRVPSHPASFSLFAAIEAEEAAQTNDFDDDETKIAWWKDRLTQPLSADNELRSVDTQSLVLEAIKNSPRIQAISQNPLIRELQIVESDAEFDAIHFVRSKFDDREDPVGNTLTTGGAPFLKDHIWSGEFGLQKKTRTGASVELSETLGFHNSNSNFFVPQDQATATLALNVTQPLMRGRGRYINQTQILIAQAASGAAWDTFVNELQTELQQVAESYWQLYFARSLLLQKQRSVSRASKILDILEGRADLDSMPNQISRTRSAVESRKTELANALRDVRNAETEIRRRIADRDWMASQGVELIPIEIPQPEINVIPLDQVVHTALEHRREITEAMQRAKIAGIQYDISVNDLLPELSLMLGTYTSALKGESQMGQAIQDHLGEVTPGYSVGFEWELPYRNRAARSRMKQRKLQLVRIKAEVDATIQDVIAESQVAVRRVESAKETLEAAKTAIAAAKQDLEQNHRRWEAFALVEGDLMDGQTPTTMLDQLLNAQERLTASELIYSQAELELKTAELLLQRTMGTLLIHEQVDFHKINACIEPELTIDQYKVIEGEVVEGEAAEVEVLDDDVIESEVLEDGVVDDEVGEE